MVVEKGMCERGRKTQREKHTGNSYAEYFPKDGLDFSSCNHQGLKVSRLAGIKLGGTTLVLERRQTNNLGVDSMETVT